MPQSVAHSHLPCSAALLASFAAFFAARAAMSLRRCVCEHTQCMHTPLASHRSLRCRALRPSLSLALLGLFFAFLASARALSRSRWSPRLIVCCWKLVQTLGCEGRREFLGFRSFVWVSVCCDKVCVKTPRGTGAAGSL